MYLETEAIVLNRRKITEADVSLTLFTRKAGRVQAIANGARNPRSRLMAASHPFVYGEFSLNVNRETSRVSQVQIIESFYQLREGLEKLALGSYLLELTEAVVQENQTHNRLFDLLIEFLTLIKGDIKGYNIVRTAFELKLFKLNGVRPQLDYCTVCNKKYDKTVWHFNIEEGGLVCPECHSVADAMEIDEVSVRLIYFFIEAPLDVILKTKISRSLIKRVLWLNKYYMKEHLSQRSFKSLEIFNVAHHGGE